MRNCKINGIVYGVLFVLGLVLLAAALRFNLDSIYSGMGGALIGVSAVRIAMCVYAAKNPDYMKRQQIENTDERNIYLAHRARSIAYSFGILICSAACIAALVLNMRAYGILLGYVVCLFLLLYMVTYFVLKRKN